MGFRNGTKSTFSMYGLSAYLLSLLRCPKEHHFVGILNKNPQNMKNKELILCKTLISIEIHTFYLCSRAVLVPGSRE